jgi:large subunit ribosomal protein L25
VSKELILMAEPRTVLGKQVKALRREGLVPGVVYGPAADPTVQVSVNRKELERFFSAHGHSTLFTLNWGGGSQQVFIKEVQLEPVRRAPLHVDFFAPNLKKELVAKVPVVLHNPNPLAEGVLTVAVSEVDVRALPSALPHQIDADISHLVHSHDALRAGDLKLPAGSTLVTDPDILLATLVAATVPAEEEAAAEEAEAAEAADEAAAEGDDEAGEAAES